MQVAEVAVAVCTEVCAEAKAGVGVVGLGATLGAAKLVV